MKRRILLKQLTLFSLGTLLVAGCNKSSQVSNMMPDEARALTDSRLKQMALATIRLRSRQNDVLPDMSSVAALQTALKPFLNEDSVGGEEVFVNPVTGEFFQPNPSLSKKPYTGELADNSYKIVLLYENSPSPNLTRGVMFADGHHERIDESEWSALKQASKIP